MSVNLEVMREDVEEEEFGGKGRIVRVLNVLREEIGGLNKRLTDFLSYALPRKLEAERVDLRSLVEESVGSMEGEFEKRGVRCEVEAGEGCEARVDVAGMGQVIRNIMLNAVEAMRGDERRVRVGLRREEGQCVLTIEDTGTGISEGDLGKIFEPFYTTREGGGGFGLAIARRIVEEHVGKIWAENREGGGTRVIIVLPGSEKRR
jgi:signal transduction histidine kinase